MNPHKYLFGFKLELSTDRLIATFQILEDILKRKFIKEYLQKDVQFIIDQTNTFAKRYYNSKHR